MLIKDQTEIQDKIVVLKKKVEHVFGRKVSSYGDCVDLSIDIFKKTGQTLNVNTLRRIFGLITYHNLPSGTTLNIFSRYCGYTSFDGVSRMSLSNQEGPDLGNSILQFLTSLFEMEHKDKQDPSHLSILKMAVRFLNQNVGLKDQFQNDIVKNSIGKAFYFEHFVNVDGLNSFYGEGLKAYLDKIQSADEAAFGHALFTYKYWLLMQDALLVKHHALLTSQPLHQFTNTSLAGRFYAGKLFYAAANNQSTENLLEEARSCYCALQPGLNGGQYANSFEFIFAQSLAYTGHFHESLLYLQAAKEMHAQTNHADESFKHSILLYEAYVYVHLNQLKKAQSLIHQVNPEAFYFLSKKIDTIIYLLTMSALDKSDRDYQWQLENLIAETGYIRFRTFINNNYLNEQKRTKKSRI